MITGSFRLPAAGVEMRHVPSSPPVDAFPHVAGDRHLVNERVQFVAGLTYAPGAAGESNGRLRLSYGVADCLAAVAAVEAREVWRCLNEGCTPVLSADEA